MKTLSCILEAYLNSVSRVSVFNGYGNSTIVIIFQYDFITYESPSGAMQSLRENEIIYNLFFIIITLIKDYCIKNKSPRNPGIVLKMQLSKYQHALPKIENCSIVMLKTLWNYFTVSSTLLKNPENYTKTLWNNLQLEYKRFLSWCHHGQWMLQNDDSAVFW